MKTTLIELNNAKISIEWSGDREQPFIVMPLDSDTFLLVVGKSLAGITSEQLDEIRRKALAPKAESEAWPDWIRPTPQKERAIRELKASGYNVSDGGKYGMQKHLDPDVTLEDVRQALSHIEGSLSDFIIAERKKQW